MTRTNNSSEHSSSRRSSSSSSSATVQSQSSSTEAKEIINQNELTIQKLLLELQNDLKKTKEYYNTSHDAWLSIQKQKSSTSSHENSQSSKNHLTQALTNVQNETAMYRTALEKIAQVRQLQIEIATATKNHNDATRNHTTRRGLADLLSHMAYTLKIWYGNEHNGRGVHKVSCILDNLSLI